MRCFVAIEIDEKSRQAISVVLKKLQRLAGSHKWVRPENLHISLKFIGNISENLLPDVCSALERASGGFSSFFVEIKGLGYFPAGGRPKVIYASVHEERAVIKNLAWKIEHELAETAGIGKEKRGFVPHITLGRIKRGISFPPPSKLPRELTCMHAGSFEVSEFVLMYSKLRPEGPEYSVVEKFALF